VSGRLSLRSVRPTLDPSDDTADAIRRASVALHETGHQQRHLVTTARLHSHLAAMTVARQQIKLGWPVRSSEHLFRVGVSEECSAAAMVVLPQPKPLLGIFN
jgi:hypothetical protein